MHSGGPGRERVRVKEGRERERGLCQRARTVDGRMSACLPSRRSVGRSSPPPALPSLISPSGELSIGSGASLFLSEGVCVISNASRSESKLSRSEKRKGWGGGLPFPLSLPPSLPSLFPDEESQRRGEGRREPRPPPPFRAPNGTGEPGQKASEPSGAVRCGATDLSSSGEGRRGLSSW